MNRISSLTRLALLGTAAMVLGVLAVRIEPWVTRRDAPAEHSPAPPPRLTLELLPVAPSSDSARSAAGPKASAAPVAHELSRRLRLLGTVLDAHPFAYIKDTQQGTSRRYWLHDTVASATIQEIRRGAVRLQTAEGRQVVLLLEPTLAAGAPERTATSSVASRSPTDLSIRFHPQLNATDGAFEGLIVEALEPPLLARRLGLEPGDLIQRINGQRLLTPAQSLQVLKKAWRQPELALEIQRDEQTLTRTVSLRAFQR